ncbi:MAG: hypothetical protein ACPGPR_07180, partial [Paracoccaceae bacterium]
EAFKRHTQIARYHLHISAPHGRVNHLCNMHDNPDHAQMHWRAPHQCETPDTLQVLQYPISDVPTAYTNCNDLRQMGPEHNCDTGMPVMGAKHRDGAKTLQNHAPLLHEQRDDQ